MTPPQATLADRHRSHAWYGWKKQKPDVRDHRFTATQHVLDTLPPNVDLRDQCPPVYDQLAIGSCTANAIAGAFEFVTMKEGIDIRGTPSRLFIYYNERDMEGTTDTDSGAVIRDGFTSVNTLGVCPETEWPYDGTPADRTTHMWPAGAVAAERPPQNCYNDAIKDLATEYMAVQQDLDQMRGCVAAGYPFVVGFQVYESFEKPGPDGDGMLSMPDTSSEKYLDGHAVVSPSNFFFTRHPCLLLETLY